MRSVSFGKRVLFSVLGLFVLLFVVWFSMSPSNDRDWNVDQVVLSYVEFSPRDNLGGLDGDVVRVYNIRNFSYSSVDDYVVQYYDRSFNLSELDSVDYVVEPFGEWEGAAHTFFSFGFSNGDYLAISIEIRKEKGESFSVLKGLFRQYEVMYVVGDENDLIKLRSNYRKDEVFLYPVNTSRENMRELFVGMLEEVNRLGEEPEFYNSLTNTCTTGIVKHVNLVSEGRIGFSWKVLAPGYSDELAYDLGLIERRGSFEETREFFRIGERAFGEGDFSVLIRG